MPTQINAMLVSLLFRCTSLWVCVNSYLVGLYFLCLLRMIHYCFAVFDAEKLRLVFSYLGKNWGYGTEAFGVLHYPFVHRSAKNIFETESTQYTFKVAVSSIIMSKVALYEFRVLGLIMSSDTIKSKSTKLRNEKVWKINGSLSGWYSILVNRFNSNTQAWGISVSTVYYNIIYN